MKKTLCLCLAAVLLALCACGTKSADPAPSAAPTPTPTTAPVTPPPGMDVTLPGTASAAPAAETAAPEISDTLRIAQSLIDESVDKLLEALGEPDFVDHAPSCIGPGEDGEYHYGSVVVYTYRDDSGEVVKDVEG